MNTPPQNFEHTIEHAKAGHATAQQVIPFIDTKTGVLLTYSFAALIGPFWTLQAVFGSDCLTVKNIQHQLSQNSTVFFWIAAVITLSVLSWALCVYACLQSVSPRRPPPNLEKKHLALFPFANVADLPAVKAEYSKIVSGLSDLEILEEYKEQLLRLGLICRQKIYWHRFACYAFMAQLIFPMIFHLGILSFLLVKNSPKFLGKPIKWTLKKAWDAIRWLPPFQS